MENRIMARLETRLGAERDDNGPLWLFTLLSVLEVERYSLEEWNEAVSAMVGHRVYCPSYRALERYLHRRVLEVE